MPDDGDRQLAGRFTRNDGERVIKTGSFAELLELRGAITESLSHIDTQLDEYRTKGGNEDWALRTRGARRAYTTWLTRISTRLAEFSSARPRSAIVIKGAAATADKTAAALNQLLAGGSHVLAFSPVGADLVVLATEPKPT